MEAGGFGDGAESDFGRNGGEAAGKTPLQSGFLKKNDELGWHERQTCGLL